MIRDQLRAILAESLGRAHQAGDLKTAEAEIEIDRPRQLEHGDLATNLALNLARLEGRPPRQVAEMILKHLAPADGFLAHFEIAGPGFINFVLADEVWQGVADEILTAGENYGRTDLGGGRRVQVEFVSANPTGPLHVGHGRGAAVGDALASLLQATGYSVEREYYINDAGRQMLILGRSVFLRYLEQLGRQKDFPQDHYQGGYITEIAARMVEEYGDEYLEADPDETAAVFQPLAAAAILEGIKQDLADFGIVFDVWFSETTLHEGNRMETLLKSLQADGLAYEEEGALWYQTRKAGDEKDRVLVKSNGEMTYFAADVAYHADKFSRGFETVIDVWGADHHGYVPRMEAAVKALTGGRMSFTAKLVQLVNLLRRGEPVAMSTRTGEFVTLREVVGEVGRDACRFIFLTRRSDSPLDFDLELAKEKSLDNPVYYVQYAHARVASIKRKAAEMDLALPAPGEADLSLLSEPEELALLRNLAAYPDLIASAARSLEPHRLTYYLTELASAFHAYYNRHRILGEEPGLSRARLCLSQAVGQVVAGGLGILGVEAPERMEREPDEGFG